MTTKAAGPRRWQPAATPKRIFDGEYVSSTAPRRQPAVCQLHGCRIVYRFPEGCACGAGNPLKRISEMQQRGWTQLADASTNDHRGGLALLDIVDTCMGCVGRLLQNPHVRHLRDRFSCNG